MAVYVYTASEPGNNGNGPVRGTVTADSPRQARDQLRARGLSVRDLAEQAPAKRPGIKARYLTSRQTHKVTGLLQEMSTLLAAGIPLLEALDTVARQHTGRFQQAIMLLREYVAAGGGLAEAMANQPMLFDNVCVNIVEVGENAGTLDTALQRLVSFRRRWSGLKNRVSSALIYPCIVLTMGLVLSVFMMTYVMPKLFEVLEQSGKDLPTVTLIVKALSDFILNWWWALVLGVGGVVLGLGAVLRSESGLRAWHRMQLKIPVLGELVRKQSIARMAMVMSTLLNSGVVFVRAIQIAQRTVGNRVLRDALQSCESAVYGGRDIGDALERTDAFPPLVVQVFAVGQASGRLESMLDDLAADYDTQVDIAASRLTALLEPLLMILLAVSVGFIAFATILPILEAGNVM